jgi:hypothetical protein
MKSSLVACSLAVLPILAAAQPAPGPQRIQTVTRLVHVFSGLERDWMDAVRQGDEAGATRPLDEAFEMRSALAPSDPVPAAEWVRSALHDFHARSLRVSDMAVRELGATALVSFRLAQEAERAGKDESGEFFVTDVWVQKDGSWKVAARYTDAPGGRRPIGMPVPGASIPKKY